MAYTAVGTAGQILVSNGAGAPSWASTITITNPVLDNILASAAGIATSL
jgi:hypothetical protein